MLQVALIDPKDTSVAKSVEEKFILPYLDIAHSEKIPTVRDYRDVPGLDVRPPDVVRYFVRVKKDVLRDFTVKNHFEKLLPDRAEDEFMSQNAFKLNTLFYSTLGDKKAFVMSHGKNMMILKIVGFAELVASYYQLEDFKSHIWIAHQRYPTKGRVWHPGGAHPFSGMHEALVHNGDFANYHSVCEYLKQRSFFPLFHTDTEASVLMLDLLNRVYEYPLEYIIEALAPTTEADFDQLSPEKQKIYRAIQAAHVHGSPDGPWFFIIARNDPYKQQFQLIGVTDTAMLRPQVFALQDGEVQIGLVCSEKQAIDATLDSLSKEDPRFCTVCDKYWNARGGSHTDGGTFVFTVKPENGVTRLTCTDKFGKTVTLAPDQKLCDATAVVTVPAQESDIRGKLSRQFAGALAEEMFSFLAAGKSDTDKATAIEVLTLLNDRRFFTGDKKRAWMLWIIRGALREIFSGTPGFDQAAVGRYRYIDFRTRDLLAAPRPGEEVLVVYTREFEPAGRPLIIAVGRPRVVINGTALDYLAESFMAGDPHAGGGFVVLNGMSFTDEGGIEALPTPYPGSNLFSLASGGAIFARDPHGKLVEDQLNGGEFAPFSDADWHLILPYLEENERLFGISIEKDLLTVNGKKRLPSEVYRKIRAAQLTVLSGVETPCEPALEMAVDI